MSANGSQHPSHPEPPASSALPRPQTRWQKARMVIKVVELRLRFIVLMAATGLTFAYWDTLWNRYEKWSRPQAAGVTASAGFEYFCPMHPTVIQADPANCPICGMPLSRRKKGEVQALPEGVVSRVQLAPYRIEQAGIRTVSTTYEPMAESLTTVGSVSFDERRLARISSKLKGMSRVESLAVNFTGVPVKAGDVLAEVYNAELYQAVQELLLAQRRTSAASSPLGKSLLEGGPDLAGLAAEKLRLWGITPAQIEEIIRTGKPVSRMPIIAPISGVVVRKNIVEGQYVGEGDSLFEIADLSHVWILAQVYEDQVGLVHAGQDVEATVEAYPGQVFKGQVAFLDPALNPSTRTMGVRYDLDNASGRLQPGMFATVTVRTPLAETPAFRAKFARVAPKGQAGKASANDQEICPVTTAKLGSMGEPIKVQLASRNVWVCCAGCTSKLKTEPARFLVRIEPPPVDGVLSVPESAVIDTGDRKLVYVEADPGVFEGRVVQLGPRIGDRFPVLDGLLPGDKVAAAGAFLIDAESRLNPATAHPAPGAETETKPEPSREATHDHGPVNPPRSASLDRDRARS